MAWEPREGCKGRYFTRTVRVNGQFRRLYFGNGPFARLVAYLDATSRAQHEQAKQFILAVQASHLNTEAPSEDVSDGTEMILHAALAIGGYHFVDRHWRRKRHG
jgi:hypothetical protein